MDPVLTATTPRTSGPVPLLGAAGVEQARLSAWCDAWECADGALRAVVFAPEAFPDPIAEPTEPVAGAIARLVRVARNLGGVLAIANPAGALGPERVALAQGVRLFGIATPEDEACWDSALSADEAVNGASMPIGWPDLAQATAYWPS